ncbi:hypothetical protein EPI10_020450 [Gossypium australe]|uniref:Uncharacterized protein n=1 Tax=Gossypium australe TaxID=47621 RepID=A0A5B6WFA6_9ROSI|nr:hypothetical protein EPI10_020450 [Gossypium australe]
MGTNDRKLFVKIFSPVKTAKLRNDISSFVDTLRCMREIQGSIEKVPTPWITLVATSLDLLQRCEPLNQAVD